MKKKNRKTPSKRKRLLKGILTMVLIIFLVGGVTGYFILRYALSTEWIKTFIVHQIFEATGRSFQYDKISIDLLGTIQLHHIKVGIGEQEEMKDHLLLNLKQLTIRYKIFPLFKRRLVIKEIIVDEPHLSLISDIHEKKDKKERKRGRRRQKDTKEEGIYKIKPLPFSLDLFEFDLQDFRLKIFTLESLEKKELSIEGLNLKWSNIQIPRDPVHDSDKVRADIHIFSESGRVVYCQGNEEFHLYPDLDFQMEWLTNRQWNITGGIQLKIHEFSDSQQLMGQIDINGKGYGEEIRINKISLNVDKQQLFGLTGEITELSTGGSFHLDIDGDQLEIQKLMDFAEQWLPPVLHSRLNAAHVNGKLRLLKGSVWGHPDSLQFKIGSRLIGGKLLMQDGFELWDANFILDVSGTLTDSGLEKGIVTGSLDIGSVMADLNDSTAVSIKEINCHWNAEADSDQMIKQAVIQGSVKDLFAGHGGLDFQIKSNQKMRQGVKGIKAIGKVWVDSIQLALLPGMDSKLDGELELSVHWDIDGFNNMHFQIKGGSQKIAYMFENRKETLPPLNFSSDFFSRMDLDMTKIRVDSGMIYFSELFSGSINGEFLIPQKRFHFSLKEAEIQNNQIFKFLPTSIEEKMYGFSIRGREIVNIDLSGQQQDDSVQISLSGILAVDNVNLVIMDKGFSFNQMNGQIKVQGDLDCLYGNGLFSINSFHALSIRHEPIRDTELSFDWRMVAKEHFTIEKGLLDIPSLCTQANFKLRVGDMASLPTVTAETDIGFHSNEWLEIMSGLQLIGDIDFQMVANTLNSKKQWLRVTGELNIDSINVVKENELTIHGLWSRLPFQIDFDQKNGKILQDSLYSPPSWIEYENQRVLYDRLHSGTKNLSIQQIDISDLTISDIGFDINIGRGYFQVPWFSMALFDGNLGGNIIVNPGINFFQDVSYSIRAQASRINSAALANIPMKKEEESELNSRLHFYGQGLQFSEEIDLSGVFDITKIGPEFADLLLKGMDPKGEDASIRQTRLLLKIGAKPELFSFELRHGLVYPSLSLTKPWFSPIPKKWEYGRLPLGFLMKRFGQLNQ